MPTAAAASACGAKRQALMMAVGGVGLISWLLITLRIKFVSFGSPWASDRTIAT